MTLYMHAMYMYVYNVYMYMYWQDYAHLQTVNYKMLNSIGWPTSMKIEALEFNCRAP